MSAPAKTRTRRSPAERAQEALDAALTRSARARNNVARLQHLLADAQRDLERAESHASYAAKHPDLPERSDG